MASFFSRSALKKLSFIRVSWGSLALLPATLSASLINPVLIEFHLKI